MAESDRGPRGLDPRVGSPSPGKAAATPEAAPLHSHRDAPSAEESDADSKTPTSSVTSSEEEEEEEEEREEGHQWQVGDACSVTWAGDGQLYPARLLALDRAAGMCLVEFDGYGNKEERALADLLPPHPGTWGVTGTPGDEGSPSSWELPPGTRRRKGKRAPFSPQLPEMMPPPDLLHALWEEEEEEDALTAMLMAWYMSGYHTGFYVGLQQGQAEAAEPPSRPGRKQKKPPRS